MATVKLTATRGKPDLKNVTIAAGTTIAGSDAIEVNIDYTKLTKGDVLTLLDAVKRRIHASKWPLL